MFLFYLLVYWDGAQLSLQVFLWHRIEWADSCAGTCWKQTPVCPGWMPGRAPALCMPLPPKWQRHWSWGIKRRRGKKTWYSRQCVAMHSIKTSGCTWTPKGRVVWIATIQLHNRIPNVPLNYFLLTCKRPPAHACCYPEFFWAAPSLEASGTYLAAGWQPSGHSGSESSRWSNAPGLSYQTNTGRDGEWAQAGMGSYPACSLEIRIKTVIVYPLNSPTFCTHFFFFFPFLPSAIAPSTRMPDSLTTHSGWKSSSLRRGRMCSSRSSLKTLANTSNAAAEHLPNVWWNAKRHTYKHRSVRTNIQTLQVQYTHTHRRQVINTLHGS